MTGATVAEIRQERLQTARRNIRSGDGNERACRQCGKAITAKWYKKYCSQECSVVGRMEYSRKRYANNPEKAKEISRRWYKNNHEKAMDNGKQWRRNNLEKAREIGRRSDEKRRIKARVARGVIKRTCRQCGKVITAWRRKAYCSQACSVVSNRECARKRRANNPEKARENSRRGNERRRIKTMLARSFIKRTCQQCGKVITTQRLTKYCSQECRVSRNREHARNQYKVNYEKINEAARKWHKDNPEKKKKYWQKWKKNNPEKDKEHNRRGYEKHRIKVKENTERWVENYLAKVREGARMEREAEGKNTGDGRRQHKDAGGIADGVKT